MSVERLALAGLGALCVALAGCPTPPRDPLPTPPVVELFTADALVVRTPATETTVRWRVTGAEVITLEGVAATPIEVSAEGQQLVEVSARRVITLVAGSTGGTARAALVLDHDDPTPVRVVRFEVAPTKVRAGDPVRVSWNAPGARGVFVRALGEQALLADGPPRGTLTYVPRRDLVLELRADGLGGPVTATASVVVAVAAPLVAAFVVEPAVAAEGQTIRVAWDVRGLVDACALVVRGGGAETIDSGRGAADEVLLALTMAGRYELTLTCEGPSGRVETRQSLVVVASTPARVQLLSVIPPVSGPGGSVELRFAASGATHVLVTRELDVLARVTAAEGSVTLLAEPETFVVRLVPEGPFVVSSTATITVDQALPAIFEVRAIDTRGRVEVSWAVSEATVVRGRAEGMGDVLFELDPRVERQAIVEVAAGVSWLALEAENAAGNTRRITRIAGR